jgi:transcriptional regulator with XRE-family HTH domain
MPLMRPLAAVLRLVRVARGLSQEEFSGVVEARHIHNLEHAKSSITLDTLETLAARLDIDPVALLAFSARIESGSSTADYVEFLQSEFQKLLALGVEEQIGEHYRDGNVVTHKPGRRTDPAKVSAVLEAKASGKSKREVSEELGIPRSTVNDLWKKS